MSTAVENPKHCPNCGELCGFEDLLMKHTCQTTCLTPRRNTKGSLIALPGKTQPSCSFLVSNELTQPLPMELMDALSLAPSASDPHAQLRIHPGPSPFLSSSASPSLPPYSRPERALAQVSTPWVPRFPMEAGLQKLTLEVQEHVSMRLGSLQEEVKMRSMEVHRAQTERERMEKEKQEAEEKAAELARQIEVSVEMMASLRQELMEREEELSLKQQEFCDLDRFVRETARREASAKIRVQSFIENLLERAERAERQLQELHTPSHTHTDVTSPEESDAAARETLPPTSYSESGISQCLCLQCDDTGSPHLHRSEMYEVCCEAQCYQKSSSDLEADSDSWSVYSTESSERLEEHYRTYNKIGTSDSGFHCHGNRPDQSVMGSMQMKKRDLFFQVFPYLDTHSLLIAAQVCKDWWSVARHPAVWTIVRLENERISSKFMVTMAQWCSQTHTLILHHLKPRACGKNESKEEYLKNTRGCLEVGLEAVLRSAGRSLVSLTISHCPNILTDRTLWLISCHCRAVQTLTYRSSSDPVGHEVIWALGAGCRDITSLNLTPLQPCQQPSRFSNRCLQMIGRCWPDLHQVGVGGAGCGLQGLASLVRNCSSVSVLELDHMSEMSQQGAAELCKEGLQQLHTLIFSYTPVTAQAIVHFHSVCRRLKCVRVLMNSAHFFGDPEDEDAKRLFHEMVSSLQSLKKRPGLLGVLQVTVDQCDI